MGFFSSGPESRHSIVFHIGSSSVLGAHVFFDTKNGLLVPHIKYATIHEMPVSTELDFKTFLSGMVEALDATAKDLTLSKNGRPDEIIIFLGSPWYAAQARSVTMSKNTNFTITKKLVDDLARKEIENFEKEELAKYQDAGNQARLIEKEVINILLNGYPSTDPYDKKASEIHLSMIVSMSPEIVLQKIEESIIGAFHTKKIKFHSFMYAGTLITRDLFMSHQQFLFVDISGEITDIALVKNGTVMDVVSFPYGKNVLLRKFAKGMDKTIPDAEALFALYRDNKMEASLKIKADKVVATITAEWTALFQVALSKLATEFLLPDVIALTITPDVLPFFTQAIQNESFTQYTLTEKIFSIVPITNSSLAPFILSSPGIFENPFTTIEALAVSKKYT